jgi:hypothetical protein
MDLQTHSPGDDEFELKCIWIPMFYDKGVNTTFERFQIQDQIGLL